MSIHHLPMGREFERSGITKCCSCSVIVPRQKKQEQFDPCSNYHGTPPALDGRVASGIWIRLPGRGTNRTRRSAGRTTVYRVHGERAADWKQIMWQARGTGCQDAMPPPRRARVPSWNREDRRKWGRRAAEARGHARPHAQRPGTTMAAACFAEQRSLTLSGLPPSRRLPPPDAAA